MRKAHGERDRLFDYNTDVGKGRSPCRNCPRARANWPSPACADSPISSQTSRMRSFSPLASLIFPHLRISRMQPSAPLTKDSRRTRRTAAFARCAKLHPPTTSASPSIATIRIGKCWSPSAPRTRSTSPCGRFWSPAMKSSFLRPRIRATRAPCAWLAASPSSSTRDRPAFS